MKPFSITLDIKCELCWTLWWLMACWKSEDEDEDCFHCYLYGFSFDSHFYFCSYVEKDNVLIVLDLGYVYVVGCLNDCLIEFISLTCYLKLGLTQNGTWIIHENLSFRKVIDYQKLVIDYWSLTWMKFQNQTRVNRLPWLVIDYLCACDMIQVKWIRVNRLPQVLIDYH